MMRRLVLRSLWAVAGVLVGAAPSCAAEPSAASIGQLEWLAGCWQRTKGERVVEEQWMRPAGGLMLGMSRTVVGGVLREFEFMQIREEQGGLVFTAKPSGQPEASFTSTDATPERVVFANPAHDFPQRIIYARAGDGSLLARIEGERDGQLSSIEYPLQRVACDRVGQEPAAATGATR